MFVRIKKSGKYKYLQVVMNYRTWGRINQRIIGSMGRLDLYEKDDNLHHVITSLIKLKIKIRDTGKYPKIPKK